GTDDQQRRRRGKTFALSENNSADGPLNHGPLNYGPLNYRPLTLWKAARTSRRPRRSLFIPALHRIFEFSRSAILRPNRDILLALKLDQVCCRQRVLAGFIELDAAITDHQLVCREVSRLQSRLNLVGLGRAGAIDGVGQHEEALHPARTRIIQIAIVLG